MLTAILDSFAYVSVILRASALAFHALILGGIVFLCKIMPPPGPDEKTRPLHGRRLIFWAAVGFATVQMLLLTADAILLTKTSGLLIGEVVGASFFLSGAAGALGAISIAALTSRRRWRPGAATFIAYAPILVSLIATSHAAGRLQGRAPLAVLSALHQTAAGVWIGGLPYLLLALARFSEITLVEQFCRRFSRLAFAGAAMLIVTAAGMGLAYAGSSNAVYGTTYGLMMGSKAVLMALALLLGAANFFVVRRLPHSSAQLPRLRRFVEAEFGVGLTIILAAASLSSQPPAIDLAHPISGAAIAARIKPQWPRLSTPPLSALSPASQLGSGGSSGNPSELQSFVPGGSYTPSGPGDIAWSEYNHHWAGVVVLTAGILAAISRYTRQRWARHWPLAFLGLALFLFLRADPENWPLGPRSFWQSFMVPEVLQHRIFVLLITAFALFQWKVETKGISPHWAGLVFPAVCAAGGAILLTHSHSLGNIQEEVLTELSHVPLAVLGVIAGWSRWLELRVNSRSSLAFARIWPICFVLIGLILLDYREA